jgi:t-SNARE complex subunit (syntaxin)
MTTIDMTEVQVLQQRIKNLEAMLTQATDLLDSMVSSANIHDICDYLADAEEFVGESRAVLEGEFEE